jgi:hypothetical protein
MAQQPEQGATSESAAPVRPGKTIGQAREFTLILPLKPGGAERTRERLRRRDQSSGDQASRELVGTLHNSRMVFFDNDTRMIFASIFDGDWDSYLEDFASQVPDQVDAVFGEADGYPGIRSPDIKDFILKYQVEADDFYIAYPEATVGQIRKGQRVLKAWEEMLDTAAE